MNSGSSLVYINSTYFIYTNPNSISLNYQDSSISLSFVHSMLDSGYFLVKAKEQLFYYEITSIKDTFIDLAIESQTTMSLQLFVTRFSLALNISNDGRPTALVIYPIGSIIEYLKVLELNWISIDEQFRMIVKLESRLDDNNKRFGNLKSSNNSNHLNSDLIGTLTLNAKNQDKAISDLKYLLDTTISIVSQLENRLDQLNSTHRTAFK